MNEDVYKFARRRKLLKCDEDVILCIYNNEDIPFSIWKRKRYPRSREVFCVVDCIICKKKVRCNTKLLSRRNLILEEICLKCGPKEIYNREEWRRANSEAQKKIQSTPEQKLKNSLAVKKFWSEHPEVKEQVRKKLLTYYEDPEYKRKVADARGKNLHALAGKYKFSDGKWVEFGSSYELCFLMWLDKEKKNLNIRKCKFYIEYKYKNRLRFYYPDFLLIQDNKKIIIEVKGTESHFYDPNKNEAKIRATEEFIKNMKYDSYWFVNEAEAEKIGLVFKRSTKIKPICKLLHKESRIKLFSKEKELRYIGRVEVEVKE